MLKWLLTVLVVLVILAAVAPWLRRPNHGATAARMTSTTRTVSSHFNMIELYTWSTPNGRKVSIMLEECGLPYRVHKVDIGKGDQFTPEYVAINPNSKIPSIVDPEGPDGGPLALMESGARRRAELRPGASFHAREEGRDPLRQRALRP